MRRMRKLNEELRERRKRETLHQPAESESLADLSRRKTAQTAFEGEAPTENREERHARLKFEYDLTQLKPNLLTRSPGRKVRSIIDFFNGRKDTPANKDGKRSTLKRSLSNVAIAFPRLISPPKANVGTPANSSNRLRRVWFSVADLSREGNHTPLSSNESQDFSSDYEYVTEDEDSARADVGCRRKHGIPDVKGLIDKFSELPGKLDPSTESHWSVSSMSGHVQET